MRTTIPWGDGTGDNIYLDYSASEGNQTVLVSSDVRTGETDRTKVITFTASGTSPVSLTVIQAGKVLTIITRNDVATTYNETAIAY